MKLAIWIEYFIFDSETLFHRNPFVFLMINQKSTELWQIFLILQYDILITWLDIPPGCSHQPNLYKYLHKRGKLMTVGLLRTLRLENIPFFSLSPDKTTEKSIKSVVEYIKLEMRVFLYIANFQHPLAVFPSRNVYIWKSTGRKSTWCVQNAISNWI